MKTLKQILTENTIYPAQKAIDLMKPLEFQIKSVAREVGKYLDESSGFIEVYITDIISHWRDLNRRPYKTTEEYRNAIDRRIIRRVDYVLNVLKTWIESPEQQKIKKQLEDLKTNLIMLSDKAMETLGEKGIGL